MVDGRIIDSIHLQQSGTIKQWVPFTPIIAPAAGSFNSITTYGAYQFASNNFVSVIIGISITDAGTGSGQISVTLPTMYSRFLHSPALPVSVDTAICGVESNSNKALTGSFVGNSLVKFNLYDGTTAASSGANLKLSFFYPCQ